MPLEDHEGFQGAGVRENIRTDLDRIQGFLKDNTQVKLELNILDGKLNAATVGGTPEHRLWREFQRMESRSLFTPRIAVITKELSPHKFVKALRRHHPLKDVGAGASHGEYSHRLQWYLIMQRHFGQGAGQLPLHNAPAKLYEFLGEERFIDMDGDHETLWAALVDTFESDATSPEWLNLNVCGIDTKEGSANWTFGTLRDAFHNRYRFRELNGFVATNFEGGTRGDAEHIDEMYTRDLKEGDPEHLQYEGSGPSPDWEPWEEISI